MFDDNGPTDFGYAIEEFEDAMERVGRDAGALLVDNLQDRTYRSGFRYLGWNPAKNDSYRQTAEWWLFDGEFVYTPEESSEIFTSVAENATFNYFSLDNHFVYDQRGFATIIREQAKTFLSENDPRLRLNTEVTGVDYNKDSVTVHTKDGSCIHADYAILTFSLGVLQRGGLQFNPPLPDWKSAAISSFDIGTYTKIFMQFDEPFWNDTQYLIYADPETRGYYPEYQPLDLEGVLEDSGLLVATVVNDQSYRVEAQSNEETQAEVMAVLRSMYGDDITDPKHLWYKRWTQTPWYVLFPDYFPPSLLTPAGHTDPTPTGHQQQVYNPTRTCAPTSAISSSPARPPARSSLGTCRVLTLRARMRASSLPLAFRGRATVLFRMSRRSILS